MMSGRQVAEMAAKEAKATSVGVQTQSGECSRGSQCLDADFPTAGGAPGTKIYVGNLPTDISKQALMCDLRSTTL